MAADTSSTERTPLLPPSPSSDDTPSRPSTPGPSTPASPSKTPFTRSPAFVTTLLFIFIAVASAGDFLTQPAQTRVFESIYCREYYLAHDPSLIGGDGREGVAEKFCKVAEVQGKVAMLKGWQTSLDGIGSLLFVIPWGWFADKYGRKPQVVLIGLALTLRLVWIQGICWFRLPLELTWISALHTILGGSGPGATAVVFTIAADVATPAQRTSFFFLVAVSSCSVASIAPVLGSLLMRSGDPWPSLFVGVAVLAFSIPISLFLPETLPAKEESAPSLLSSSASSLHKSPSSFRARLLYLSTTFQTATAFLTSDIRLLALLPSFLLHIVYGTPDVLLQYTSTRYALSISTATVLVSIRSAVIAFNFLVALPWLSHLFTRRLRLPALRSDLLLIRISAFVGALGFFAIAFAGTIPALVIAFVVNTGGAGLFVLLKSFMAGLVEARHVARLYSIIAVIDSCSYMAGSLAMAWLFEVGLEWGRVWSGVVWVACGLCLMLIGVVACMMGAEGWSGESEEEEDGEVGIGRETEVGEEV
ncbi:MFS general substrate transporter [Aulographum hederae CBS 113979]|uniref:MFS general substrate transporter n=1 Tax=Aulographum hederae CBS 113979 TaxID=1176131 RepID=A0A6G1HE38_9PEZI|nr:MFS general substrate transporter [Aulographum hederae CBS 113979]